LKTDPERIQKEGR